MSQVLLDLNDYVITSSGDVGVRWNRLVEHLRQGRSLVGIKALPNRDVEKYNSRRDKAHQIPVVELNDHDDGVPETAYEWRLPEEYRDLDVTLVLAERLYEKFAEPSDEYIQRVVEELVMMRQRGMEDFLRTLIFMHDCFDRHDIVHGIGRGSACASLVLYLIGVHMVDPIEYEIPISEFLR